MAVVDRLLLLEWLLLVVAGLVACGVFVYVAGSYALMRQHAGPRRLRASLREMMREAVWSLATQPLLPWYYAFGARLAGGDKTPVIAVHGYMQNRINFIGIARKLRQRGLGPVLGFNYPWYRSVAHNSTRLASYIERVCRDTGKPKVILVCHSMGGLVAVHYLLHRAGSERVLRCVTIGSPHSGILYRGPVIGAPRHDLRSGSELVVSIQAALPVPVLSIASTHDNVVHPQAQASLSARGGSDFVVEGPGHLALLFDERVLTRVADFVADGT